MFFKSLNKKMNQENNVEDLFILRTYHSLEYYENTLLDVNTLITLIIIIILYLFGIELNII